jgi:hypothetical protein
MSAAASGLPAGTASSAAPARTIVSALRVLAAAALLATGYGISFSHHYDDALDTARWMQTGNIQKMFEFRHLISRVVPFWLWEGLRAAGVRIEALTLLELTDFACAICAVLVVAALLRRLRLPTGVAFGATFAFATSWAFWMYVGTGRPYSTATFFAVAAYFVALGMDETDGERARWLRAAGAGALALLGCLFWLQQATNCIGVGLLVALRPRDRSLARRAGYLALYSATGIFLAAAILFAGLHYTGLGQSPSGVQGWVAGTPTAPLQLTFSSAMKASFGNAAGVVNLDSLPYMVNGILLHDPRLLAIGSLPWQLAKFALAWAVLIPIYLYPLLAFRRAASDRRAILACFFIPLALNLIFALLWLGSDEQRFLPSLLSLVVLGALGLESLLGSLANRAGARKSAVAVVLIVAGFFAGDNLAEGTLREQRQFTVLAQEMQAVQGRVNENDFILFFGRDFSITYHTMVAYYLGPSYIDMGDAAYYDWTGPNWRRQLASYIEAPLSGRGRVFVVDRLALGLNPVSAAWSEIQRPHPTVREVSQFLRDNYCLHPAWSIGPTAFWQLERRSAACATGESPR